jgi:hypothetical protein
VTCRGHGVGLVVGAVDPNPAAFTAHDHGLVLTEACDVSSDEWATVPLEWSFLRLDPLRLDQRVVGDVRKLTQHLRLVDGRGHTQHRLRSSTHSGGTKSGSSSSGTFSLVYAGVSKALIVSTCQPDPGLQIGGEVGCGVIRVANRDNASVDVALGMLTQAGTW